MKRTAWKGRARIVERYAAAAVLTLVGSVVIILFQHLRGVPDALVFAAIVALSARFLGTGPGLLASALSIIAIDLTILPPRGGIELTHPEELAYVAVFVVLVLVINGTTHTLRTAQASAEGVAARATRLLEVTTALSEAMLPRDVARVVISQGLAVTEATSGLVGVIDGDKLRVLDWRPSSSAAAPTPPNITLDGDGPLAEALRRREPVWLESRERFRALFPNAYTRIPRDSNANAFVAFPLLHGDEVVGGLVMGFGGTSAFGATDQTFAGLLAQLVGDALARARRFEHESDSRREAETMARAREEVLGVVAHDLRNPLGVVGSAVQVLRELDLAEPEREKLLASGARAVQQMNRLIGDLLDVIRLETGHLSLVTELLSVDPLLDDAVESVRHLATQRDIRLSIEHTGGALHVRADRGRLAQVFGNLLGNAVKFTPKDGRIELRSRAKTAASCSRLPTRDRESRLKTSHISSIDSGRRAERTVAAWDSASRSRRASSTHTVAECGWRARPEKGVTSTSRFPPSQPTSRMATGTRQPTPTPPPDNTAGPAGPAGPGAAPALSSAQTNPPESTMSRIRAIAFGSGISFLAGAGAMWAQQQTQAATRREPQFENAYVRAWKSTIMPKQPLTLHRHDHGRALIALTNGRLNVVNQDGKVVTTYKWERGRAYWLDADPPGQMHADRNDTSRPIEVIVVELKTDK